VVMGEQRTDWSATKKMLSRPDLLEKMLSIASKDAIDASTLTALHGYIEMPGFAPEQVANVSKAAHNLCLWIHGVYKHQVVVAGERGTPLVLSPTVGLAGTGEGDSDKGGVSPVNQGLTDSLECKESDEQQRACSTMQLNPLPHCAAAEEQASLEMQIKIDTATAEENAKRIGTTAAAMSDDNTESAQKLVEGGVTKADMKELKSMHKPPVQVRVVVVYVKMFGVCLWALIWLGAGHSGIM